MRIFNLLGFLKIENIQQVCKGDSLIYKRKPTLDEIKLFVKYRMFLLEREINKIEEHGNINTLIDNIKGYF